MLCYNVTPISGRDVKSRRNAEITECGGAWGLKALSSCSLNDARRADGLTGARPTLLRSFTRQCGATLALLALTLQLVLSFGHLHARDISASGFVFAKANTADG